MMVGVHRWWPAAVLACFILLATGVVAAEKPAIVLAAPDTSTETADACKHIADKVKERFPDHDIRLVSFPASAGEKPAEATPSELPDQDLTRTLADLKAAGLTRVAVQSLEVLPGLEWETILKITQETKGLKIALGKPLLSSLPDRKRLLDVLAKDFPADPQNHAVLLVGPGSTTTAGMRENLSLYTLMLSKLRGKNVFFGVIAGPPPLKNALGAIKKSTAGKVTIVPLRFAAGDHWVKDITGDKDSIRSDLLAARPYEIQAVDTGLGSNDAVIQIYLDHLNAALDTFVEKKKEKKPKRRKK